MKHKASSSILAATALAVAAFGWTPLANAGVGIPQHPAGVGIPQKHPDRVGIPQKHPDKGVFMRKAGGDIIAI